MSLTSEMKSGGRVHFWLKEAMPNLPAVAAAERKRLAPYKQRIAAPRNSGRIGTALDLGIRECLKAGGIRGDEVVQGSLKRMQGGHILLLRDGTTIPMPVAEGMPEYAESIATALKLANEAAELALIAEPAVAYFRSSRVSEERKAEIALLVSQDIAPGDAAYQVLTPEHEVTEINGLLEIARREFLPYLEGRHLILGPTFGRMSAAVGSADADLIAGDCLWEIKTVADPARECLNALRQAACYGMMAWLSGVAEVRKLGVYWARYGVGSQWHFRDVLERGAEGGGADKGAARAICARRP